MKGERPQAPIGLARRGDRLKEQLDLLRCHYNFIRPHGAADTCVCLAKAKLADILAVLS